MNGDVNELIESLRVESERHRKRLRTLKWITGSALAIGLSAWLTVVLVTGHGAPDLVTPLPILVFAVIAAMTYSPKHKSLVAELAARKDPRIVSDLVEAAHSKQEDVRKLAENALPDILGVWLSGNSPSLQPQQRCLLYRLLDPQRPIELVEAVLIVIRSEGGPEALPYLERLQERVEGNKITRWQRLSGKILEVKGDVRLREAKRIIDKGPQRDDVESVIQQA